MARSKSRSRASASKKSKSPVKKSTSAERSPSKSPSRAKRSTSRSRGRPTKEDVKTTPKRAASKTRVASRSSSRSRAPKTPAAVKSVATPATKKSPVPSPSSSTTSPVRSTARTFERADDDVPPLRNLRSLTQSRERPASAQKAADTPKTCAIGGNLCQKVCEISKNIKTRAQNSNRYLKRRLGVWYGETIALIIIIAILALVVSQILHYDPAKLRIFVTHNFNKAVSKTAATFNHVKDVIKKKIQ